MSTLVPTKESQDPASRKKQSKRISMRRAIQKFLGRADSKYKLAPYEHYNFAMMALREYINSFIGGLLRAQGAAPSIVVRSNKEVAACDIYEPAVVVPLLRSFRIFYLEHKGNAPLEVKALWNRIVEEFIGWLVEGNYLETQHLLDFLLTESRNLVAAAHAEKVLRNSMAHQKRNDCWEDVHGVEPLYMVSRVKSGRLWFLYAESPWTYQELGPVAVPLGASDLIKPGWCIQSTFGKRDGQWQLVTVGTVLAV